MKCKMRVVNDMNNEIFGLFFDFEMIYMQPQIIIRRIRFNIHYSTISNSRRPAADSGATLSHGTSDSESPSSYAKS